jgi:predicted ATP-dependent protease
MERSSTSHASLSLATHAPLAPHQLRMRTAPSHLRFDTREQESSCSFSYCQPRAEKALALGIQMRNAGHIFVCGPSGTARRAVIEEALKRHGRVHSALRDYLSVFPVNPQRRQPVWMTLPAGKGRPFLASVDQSIRACQERLRKLIQECLQDGEQPWDEARRREWLEDVEEALEAHVEPLRQEAFDPDVLGYLAVLHKALADRMKRGFDLAALLAPGNATPQDLERLLDQASRLAEYRPQLIRETDDEQVPVVFEPNPTLQNLFGCVVREECGSDGSASERALFQPGSLLKAQGGFLVLDFEEVAAEPPEVWRHLKRCLRYERLEVPVLEPGLGTPMGLLKPEPIPLQVKLVAWGDERLYQEFYERDPAFGELFRIRADLDSQMDRNDENILSYLAFLRKCCREEGLLPFLPTGAASFIDAGAELAGKQKKLTSCWNVLADLVREASHLAQREGSPSVRDHHVEQAQEERRYRRSLPEEQLSDLIREDALLIQTDGGRVGQVNGLALYETEDFLFGKPCRITAQTGMGRSGVINIEREVNLSGKIHDKGVLILCGFLRNRFAQDKPLTLGASICIEQFYSEIDGDSASLGEICALLSSLANVPLQQGIAVTGSISQMGDVQTIGCVNEKVLGFFDVCLHRGLTGNQGVILPAGNVEDLMLPRRVIQAAEQGKFRLYAVQTVDQAMEILTGRPAGQPDRHGRFPQGSLNGLVDQRLWELATGLRDFLGDEEGPEEGGPSAE